MHKRGNNRTNYWIVLFYSGLKSRAGVMQTQPKVTYFIAAVVSNTPTRVSATM
jgi:hypothetical protein